MKKDGFSYRAALGLCAAGMLAGCADFEERVGEEEGRTGTVSERLVSNPGTFEFDLTDDSSLLINEKRFDLPPLNDPAGDEVYSNAITLSVIGATTPPSFDVDVINTFGFADTLSDMGSLLSGSGTLNTLNSSCSIGEDFDVILEFKDNPFSSLFNATTGTASATLKAKLTVVVDPGGPSETTCTTADFFIPTNGLINDTSNSCSNSSTLGSTRFCLETPAASLLDIPATVCANSFWTSCVNQELGLGDSSSDSSLLLNGETAPEMRP